MLWENKKKRDRDFHRANFLHGGIDGNMGYPQLYVPSMDEENEKKQKNNQMIRHELDD